MFFILSMLGSAVKLYAPTGSQDISRLIHFVEQRKEAQRINAEYEKIWNAVIHVESRGNPMAYNPDEGATGIAQIRQIRVDDYNRRTGSNYLLEQMYDPDISKEIFMYYARLIGYENPEWIARRWNGSGRMTVIYWNKVKELFYT